MFRMLLARRLSLLFGIGFFLGGGKVKFCAGIFRVLLETVWSFFGGGGGGGWGGLIFVHIRASP